MALDRRTAAVAVLVVLAAGAVGVAAGAVVSGGSGTGTPVGVSGPAGTGPTASAGPTTPPATTTAAPRPAPGVTVPVYVLGDTTRGARLYREFRKVAGSPAADHARLAVAALGMTPADPDYRSPWTGARLTGITRRGADATVTFASPPRLRSGDAAMAVQQVVHTVTAADPTVKRVRVAAPGLPAKLTAAPAPRGPQLDVLAPVWLVDPVDGARVGRKLELGGTASVFEATVSVEVRKGGAVVRQATATAQAGAPARGEWTVALELPPGSYTVVAFESSAKDGSKQFEDSKRITVT